MAADDSRIDELRRRVRQDPASIAFAQLAEECRRSGLLEEAVRVCRAGLVHHPAYLSARVTLGRALMALGREEAALVELEYVLRVAPDHLLALRSLDELQQHGRQAPADPVLDALEGWLAAILADRVARAGSGGSASRHPPY